MSNHDYYLMVHPDNTVDVYTREHIYFGMYSSLSRCYEMLHTYMLQQSKRLSIFYNGAWISLHDDDEWVTFILTKQSS